MCKFHRRRFRLSMNGHRGAAKINNRAGLTQLYRCHITKKYRIGRDRLTSVVCIAVCDVDRNRHRDSHDCQTYTHGNDKYFTIAPPPPPTLTRSCITQLTKYYLFSRVINDRCTNASDELAAALNIDLLCISRSKAFLVNLIVKPQNRIEKCVLSVYRNYYFQCFYLEFRTEISFSIK